MMALRRIDLRAAAQREYPELRAGPRPLTWWQVNCWWVTVVAILYSDMLLWIAVTITRA
jgi:hypothetical protein